MKWYEALALAAGITGLVVAGYGVVQSQAEQKAMQEQLLAAQRAAAQQRGGGDNTAATLINAGAQLINGLGGIGGILDLIN